MTTFRITTRPLAASILALTIALPAFAQQAAQGDAENPAQTQDQIETPADALTDAPVDTSPLSEIGTAPAADIDRAQVGDAAAPAPAGTDAADGEPTLTPGEITGSGTTGQATDATGDAGSAQTGDAQMDDTGAPFGVEIGPDASSPIDRNVSSSPGSAPDMMSDRMESIMAPPGFEIDLESFAEDLYERGYRQGYIRGIRDARARMMQEMQRRQQEADRQRQQNQQMGRLLRRQIQGAQDQDMQQRRPRMQDEGPMRQPGGGQGSETGGTILILPPGITPQMLMEQIGRMNTGQ
jgi:hypothetical protein